MISTHLRKISRINMVAEPHLQDLVRHGDWVYEVHGSVNDADILLGWVYFTLMLDGAVVMHYDSCSAIAPGAALVRNALKTILAFILPHVDELFTCVPKSGKWLPLLQRHGFRCRSNLALGGEECVLLQYFRA